MFFMKEKKYEIIELDMDKVNDISNVLKNYISNNTNEQMNLLLDFKNINYIISDTIVKIIRFYDINNLKLGLINVNQVIIRVFKITKAIEIVKLFNSEEEVKNYFN